MSRTSKRHSSVRIGSAPSLPSPADFYHAVLDLKRDGNPWAAACCPFHDDDHPSLMINLESGAFRCLSGACGVSGPSIVSFVMQLEGLDYAEAADWIRGCV